MSANIVLWYMIRFVTLLLFSGILITNSVQAKHWIHIHSDQPKGEKTALLIMNGFGGTRAGCKAQMAFWQEQGMDVYIPEVLLRKSLDESSEAMDEFITSYRLDEYKEVKAICYIAGAFLLHTYLEESPLPNLTMVIYDRSPTQERAPRAVMERIPFLGKLKLGSVLGDLSTAEWPIPPAAPVQKGLVIENRATSIMRYLQAEAMAMGPLVYDWKLIDPSANDAFHVALDHDMMYVRWDILGEPFVYFFEHGRFPADLPRERIHDRPFDPKMPIPE